MKRISLSIVGLMVALLIITALVTPAVADETFAEPGTLPYSGTCSNPDYAHADDSLRAEFNDGQYLIASGFGFESLVPSPVIYVKFSVRIQGRVSDNDDNDVFNVSLSWDGGTSWTSSVATKDVNNEYNLDDQIIDRFDLPDSWTDMWSDFGRTWSHSELSDANFRIKLTADCGPDETMQVDRIRVQVTYRLAHSVTASVDGTGGTISPSGTIPIAHGDNPYFTITPDTGYIVSDVVLDELTSPTSLGRVNEFQFESVTTDREITAHFTGGWHQPSKTYSYAWEPDFLNPEFAFSSDQSVASALQIKYAQLHRWESQCQIYSHFTGLIVPDGAIINGIEVALEGKRAWGTEVASLDIFFTGNDYFNTFSPTNTGNFPANESTIIIGSPFENFGLDNSDDFLPENFKILLCRPEAEYQYTDIQSGIRLDQIQVRVYYTENANPVANAGGPYTVNEGDTISLDGSASYDPNPGDVLTYAWDLNNDGTFETPSQSPLFTAGDGPANVMVALQVCDDNGACDTSSIDITVNNVAPTPSISGAPTSSPEGTVIDLGGSATDPGSTDTAAGFIYAWSVTKNGNSYASGSGDSFSFTPEDDGTYLVTLSATDKDNDTGTASRTIIVTNAAPTVEPIGDTQNYSGQTHQLTATFTDPGVLDTHTATIDWGDGSATEAGMVSDSGGSGTVTGSHDYFVPGTYTITITVTDKDGGHGSGTGTKVVKHLPINIDIKPGSDPNSINLKSNGKIPVVVFGGVYEDFTLDIATIDWSTVYFAGALALNIGRSPEDLDGDGILDQVFHFNTQDTNLTAESTEACLTGMTTDGTYFEGCDSVRIVPAKNNYNGEKGKGKNK